MALGGTEAMLVRAQLIVPNNHFLSADFYNQMFTMHGLTMIFLVVMPLETGFFGNFLIPLQIGARDVAFPRLNALSFWVFLLGALSLNFGWIWGGLPNGGWFGYANLTERAYAPGLNIDYYDVGLLILGVSSVMSGAEFLRHHRQYARPRHDLHAHADVHLGAAGDGHPAAAGLPGADRRPHLPLRRPLLRLAFL